MKIKFVSIDSSLANTGVAIGYIDELKNVVVESIYLTETKKTKNKQIRASSDSINRGRQTYNFVKELIELHKPQVIFAETPSGSQSSAGMKSYGMTCMLIAALTPSPIEVTPIEVKVAVIGKKTASKGEMMEWATLNYPNVQWGRNKDGSLKNKNEHCADACAIVHAGIKTNQFNQLFEAIKNLKN